MCASGFPILFLMSTFNLKNVIVRMPVLTLCFKMDTCQFLMIRKMISINCKILQRKQKVKITDDIIIWIPLMQSASAKSILSAKCKMSGAGDHLL